MGPSHTQVGQLVYEMAPKVLRNCAEHCMQNAPTALRQMAEGMGNTDATQNRVPHRATERFSASGPTRDACDASDAKRPRSGRAHRPCAPHRTLSGRNACNASHTMRRSALHTMQCIALHRGALHSDASHVSHAMHGTRCIAGDAMHRMRCDASHCIVMHCIAIHRMYRMRRIRCDAAAYAAAAYAAAV